MFRRILAFVLAWMLCFGCVGGNLPVVHAESAPLEFYDIYINPLYEDSFSESDLAIPRQTRAVYNGEYIGSAKELAAVIRNGMKNRQETLNLQINAVDQESLKALIREAFQIAIAHTGVPTEGDYLRWQYGGWRSSGNGYYADDGSIDWDITLTVSYYTTAAQEAELDRRIDAVLDELNVDNATEYQKILAIYDYICENVTYDYENLEDKSYYLKHSAYAAMMHNTAVCQGYAVLFYRLALELGVDSRLISGDGGGPHGWNIAQIGTLYYNLDSTWDAGMTSYNYFLRSSSNFGNHTRDAEYDTKEFHAQYPMATSDYVDSKCNHNYAAEATKEATCLNSGSRTWRCSKCGDSYVETIAALGHTEVAVKGTSATCTESGLTDGRKCSTCGVVTVAQSTIAAKGHSWNAGVVTKEPTEKENGVRTYTCTACKATKTESIAALEHTHKYTSVVTKPTCTEAGYTTYTCTCGDTYTDNAVAALGHSWNAGVVTKEPTEKETGVRTYTCTTCKATKTETIAALEHTHKYTSVVTKPTCTEAGYTTYTCTCGNSYTGDNVAALGHTEVTVKGTAATCTKTGLTDGVKCSVCNVTITAQKEIAALGHSWNAGVVTKEPTEKETGVRTFTCTVCQTTKTESIPELGHEHKYTAAVTAATCTKDGFTTYTCTCGNTYTADVVAAPGHTEVVDKAVEASCENTGLTEGKHCSVCNEVLIKQENIPALGHTWDEGVVTKEPAKDEPGIRTYTCKTCRKTRTEEIPYEGAEESSVERIAGANRVSTALAVATELKEVLGVDKFDAIIIAAGGTSKDTRKFADALSGSYLASVKNAPILLYTSGNLAAENLAFIKENLSKNGTVYLLGGEAAVPASVADAVEGYKVERLYGNDRYETNRAILNEAGLANAKEILIATGDNFADCLSASATGLPIMLVKGTATELNDQQIEFLKGLKGKKFTILGGEAAVSAELEAAIEAVIGADVERIKGEKREETSTLIAKKYFATADFALIAYSKNYPDGLAGGVLANALGAPLLLTNTGNEKYASAYIEETGIESGYILGGTAVVTDATAKIIFGLS